MVASLPGQSPLGQCSHRVLVTTPSPQAAVSGYSLPSEQQRVAATMPQGRISVQKRGQNASSASVSAHLPKTTSFPAPLVLPGDDLDLDSDYPAQSLLSWTREKERNKVTAERRTIYVAAPPTVSSSASYVSKWTELPDGLVHVSGSKVAPSSGMAPQMQSVIEYLTAFYHGLPVQALPQNLIFTHWDEGGSSKLKKGKKKSEVSFIGLQATDECIRIRTRASPDHLYSHQLNLDDLLDTAIAVLPDDAYALLLLVDHDLYESDEDLFVCGRAYGGSRVAVVSTARYHYALDEEQNVEQEHAWPASHCAAYVQDCCKDKNVKKAPKHKKPKLEDSMIVSENNSSPIQAAIAAHIGLPLLTPSSSSQSLIGLWLGRVCRTASHELGHCFGIDHCVYYACSMQGSASISEDARQPPYLCPVDLAKVLKATGGDAEGRYRALFEFCEKHNYIHLFAAFSAWIRARQLEMTG